MRHRTRLNDIKKRKKRAGLSLLAKKRIIGISTMILAGLLMAVPFFSRAADIVTLDAGGLCGATSSDQVLWMIRHPDDDTENKNLELIIYGNGAMKDYSVSAGKIVDTDGQQRPWQDYMDGIKIVTVEVGVTHVGDYAFSVSEFREGTERTVIDVVEVGASNDYPTTIGEGAFWGSKVKTLFFSPHVTEISDYAFYKSDALETITFGANDPTHNTTQLESIGDNAFAECPKLTSITGDSNRPIPEGIKTIGNGAFYNDSALTTITIPNSVTSIGRVPSSTESLANIQGAFENCSKLESVTFYTGAVSESSLETIGAKAFKGTALKGALNLPQKTASDMNKLTAIGEEAFHGLSGLTGTLSVPDTVTNIGAGAFALCSGFTGSLSLPPLLLAIDTRTFSGCSGLSGTLSIPEGIKTIGDYAFLDCDGIENIIFKGKPTSIGTAAFEQTTNNAPRITFSGDAPDSVIAAGDPTGSFDEEDIIIYPSGNESFEKDINKEENGIFRWHGYRVKAIDTQGDPVFPDFVPTKEEGVSDPTAFTSTKPVSSNVCPDEGKGFRLLIKPFDETVDPIRAALDAGTNPPSTNALYQAYDISLYDYRSYYDGSTSPERKQIKEFVGDITVTMSLPTEIVAAIAQDTAAGRLDNLSDRLSLYTENTGASPIQKLSFTDEGVVNNSRLISFTATHFSEFSLVYEPYVEKAFYVVDLRDDQHGDGKSRLFRGTGEGAPKRETFDVIYGTSEADAEPQNKATNPMNGYFLEIRPDEGEDIREAAWRDDGKGLQLAEKDWLLAPCDIRLFYDDGTGTEGAITEKKTDFGTINIQLPIPPEMTETDRIELLTLSYEGKLERGTERNGAFRVATRTDGNASQLFAYFEATHFSEYALYYVLDSAASDTSTTASTSSTEATTATGATTSSAAGGTTATGATTSNAAAAGSTATGANTASTATTATTSSTLASGASVAASTGGSGATNRAGATTPVAVTTGSSGSASGSDMPTTGDSDFYRMTLSMALMLFGAYELISTIRIRKKGNR